MGKVRTFTRRAFLVGSAAIAGGVAFGAYLVKRDPDNPLQAGLGAGEATFNPWVMINSERVTQGEKCRISERNRVETNNR